jgi:hypothetical protein
LLRPSTGTGGFFGPDVPDAARVVLLDTARNSRCLEEYLERSLAEREEAKSENAVLRADDLRVEVNGGSFDELHLEPHDLADRRSRAAVHGGTTDGNVQSVDRNTLPFDDDPHGSADGAAAVIAPVASGLDPSGHRKTLMAPSNR